MHTPSCIDATSGDRLALTGAQCALVLCLGLCSITVRVVGVPSEQFEGTSTFSFKANGVTYSMDSEAAPTETFAGVVFSTSPSNGILQVEEGTASFNVNFYHCAAGNVWTAGYLEEDAESDFSCELCTDIVEGDEEVR